MSVAFGKVALFMSSTAANRATIGILCNEVRDILSANTAQITEQLNGKTPAGYILIDKVHSSPSDSRPHSTVDAFDSDDKPIGCVHVYPNNEVQAFVKARSLALEAYQRARNAAQK